MKIHFLIIFQLLLSSLFFQGCESKSTDRFTTKSDKDAHGYHYTYVTNDPTNSRIYTLANGLKVYLSKNEIDPKIQTMVVFKVGSAHDPETNTGLSHYLEHLLFKGTSQIGTQNWEKEKPLLDTLARMFDRYGMIKNEMERKKYYASIDSVSQEAAHYGIAEELRRLFMSLGANYVNASTFKDHTAYFNPIPKNELERWAMISGHRFREFVPRYFHTELETVYEEYNTYEGRDFYLAETELERLLFSDHPYGQKTTLGRPEHLKKPSINAIKRFFDTHYRPENAAVCLSGDLEFDDAIQIIDQYFGDWKSPDLPLIKENISSKHLTSPVKSELVAPGTEYFLMGFKMPGTSDVRGMMMARLISTFLYSGDSKSGLFYDNIVNPRHAHNINVGLIPRNQGSIFQITAYPIEGQSFTDLEALVLDQMSKLRNGDFEEWLQQASVNILENEYLANIEQNFGRSWVQANTFSADMKWEDQVTFYKKLKQISKNEVIDFAREWLKPDSYAIVYKKSGQRTNNAYISKPEISAVPLNTDIKSTFAESLENEKPENQIGPKFYNFSTDIVSDQIGDHIPLFYNKNQLNDRFWLIFSFKTGIRSEPRMELALDYINQLGTAEFSSERFRKELLRIGCKLTLSEINGNIRYIIEGREPNFIKALELFSDFVNNMQPDQQLLDQSVRRIIEDRSLQRKNRYVIQAAMNEYLKYGENSKFLNWLTEDQLRNTSANSFTEWIKSWFQYEYEVYYGGTRSISELKKNLNSHFSGNTPLLKWPENKDQLEPTKNNLNYFINYDMNQCDVLLTMNGPTYDSQNLHPYYNMYRRYFGNNILNNEIRESRALAYTAALNIRLPEKKDQNFFLEFFLGTQVDKLPEALEITRNLISEMPQNENEFNTALSAYIQAIKGVRFYNLNLLNDYIQTKNRGIDTNIFEIIYKKLTSMEMDDLVEFHSNFIKSEPIKIGVIGPKDKMDFNALRKIGEFEELTINDLFGEN
ncbi:MAG TPA: insulinase family protein [Saprospiraceae bacterium]|nr:insulinase family protein [Saprospiraceae bacterium]